MNSLILAAQLRRAFGSDDPEAILAVLRGGPGGDAAADPKARLQTFFAMVDAVYLQAERDLLRVVLDGIDSPVFVKDAAHRHLELNAAAAQWFGRSREELIGATEAGIFPERQVEEMWQRESEVLATGRCSVHEARLSFAGAPPRWVLIARSPRTLPGGERIVIGLTIDIGPLKRVQHELEAARDAAEQASRAKGGFLANMSHEIRTPMSGVLGMSELLLETDLDEEQVRYVSHIRTSAESLLAVINDILDTSKMESGRLELERLPFDALQTVQEVVELLGMRANAKAVALSCTAAPGLALRVLGDAGRLRQVLLNLVGNALKFTPAGEVSVRIVRGALPCAGNCRCLRFEVHDTGIGIEPAVMGRLFRPFAQADTLMARRFGGTGLGLAISRQLVTLMGGEIGVEARPAGGTMFWFEVPFEPAGDADAAMPRLDRPVEEIAALARHARGPRVLLVEDNEVNQMIAKAALRWLGCSVHVAANGCDAVAAFTPGDWDLVLMDCQMPVMDGYEATRMIREIESRAPGGRRVPVVALTAHALVGERERCLAAGMDDFLAKPYKRDQLAEVIQRWGMPAG